MWFIDFVNIIA